MNKTTPKESSFPQQNRKWNENMFMHYRRSLSKAGMHIFPKIYKWLTSKF